MMINATLLVMIGGGVGAALRFHAGRIFGSWGQASGLPLGTLFVNILGGFLMGLLMAYIMRSASGTNLDLENYRLFLGVGLLGGFTTFSAFSLEMMLMIERGDFIMAFSYALISVILALAAVFVAMLLIRWAL